MYNIIIIYANTNIREWDQLDTCPGHLHRIDQNVNVIMHICYKLKLKIVNTYTNITNKNIIE